MTNNATIFYEQQRSAFYSQHFDVLTLQELEEYVARFRPKKEGQFPQAEYIFKKKFAFLPATLTVLQSRKKAVVAEKTVSKQVLTLPEKKEDKPNNTVAVKINKATPTKKQRSKLGVVLESSKSDDSDNSILVPEEFEDIITASLKQKHNTDIGLDYGEEFIENASLSKKEARMLNSRFEWVNQMVVDDEAKSNSIIKQTMISSHLVQGPLLLSINDVVRVSTPNRTRYNENKVFIAC